MKSAARPLGVGVPTTPPHEEWPLSIWLLTSSRAPQGSGASHPAAPSTPHPFEPIARSKVYLSVSPRGSGPVMAAVAISGYCIASTPRTSSTVICGLGHGDDKSCIEHHWGPPSLWTGSNSIVGVQGSRPSCGRVPMARWSRTESSSTQQPFASTGLHQEFAVRL